MESLRIAQAERRGSCPARPKRCLVAAHPDVASAALMFASFARERKYSACRRYTSSASGAASSSSVAYSRIVSSIPRRPLSQRRRRFLTTSDSRSSRSASQTASAASSEKLPLKTASFRKSSCSLRLEQVVAPLDRRAQRLLPGRRVARARGQQGQPPVEPREELVRIQSATRAAASSIASGSPSSRRQISPTAPVGRNPGRPPAPARRRGLRRRRRATARPGNAAPSRGAAARGS